MEQVNEKQIVEKLKKDLWAINTSDFELHINWFVVLIFALKRKIYYDRMKKETYENELNYENVLIKHCQKHLKMTDDEVKEAYEYLRGGNER